MRKILVLTGDRAVSGQPSLVRAAELAARSGDAIVLLDVVYDPHLEGYLGDTGSYEPLRSRIVAERQSRLEGIAGELRGRGLSCEAKALWAHPWHMAIVREAAAADIDLVVLEPDDERGVLSHDEWRLISMVPAPALVVRDRAARPYASVVAAVDPTRWHDKPADLDAKILGLADRLRTLSAARLEVVHCVPPLSLFVRDDGGGETSLRSAEKTLLAKREQEFGALVADAGLPGESATLVSGKPAEVLAERSAASEPTLIVLGTVQRGPVARFLIGSTAQRVLRAQGGDVAVIKPAFVGSDTPA